MAVCTRPGSRIKLLAATRQALSRGMAWHWPVLILCPSTVGGTTVSPVSTSVSRSVVAVLYEESRQTLILECWECSVILKMERLLLERCLKSGFVVLVPKIPPMVGLCQSLPVLDLQERSSPKRSLVLLPVQLGLLMEFLDQLLSLRWMELVARWNEHRLNNSMEVG
eukprot:3625651-Rhodomonas_salina.2